MMEKTIESFKSTLDILVDSNPHARNKGDEFKEWSNTVFSCDARISYIKEQRQITNRVSEQFRYFAQLVVFVCVPEVKREKLIEYILTRAYSSLQNVAIIGVNVVGNQKEYTFEKIISFKDADFSDWAKGFFDEFYNADVLAADMGVILGGKNSLGIDDIFNHDIYGIHINKKNDALSVDNPHICIGWSALGNLSKFQNINELKEAYEEIWPESNNKSKGQNISQIWRFFQDMNTEDYVIYADKQVFHIGKIISDYYYDDTEYSAQDSDYKNYRKVEWLKTDIPTSDLSQAFRKSLTASMSVWTLNDYKSAVQSLLDDSYIKDTSVEYETDDADIYVGESLVQYHVDNYPTLVDEGKRKSIGRNVLLYGVPGSGKSYTVANEYCVGIPEENIQRVVFHPDYSYSDFIGQILPKVLFRSDSESSDVTYEFSPGPFTNILASAYANPLRHYVLIIEELNRGNAPAIFGEMFQLLDRKLSKKEINDNGLQIGSSEYGVANGDVARIVYGDSEHKVFLPSNLEIIATMNTSDQNVYTLDTAFQRRWQMRLLENSFDEVRDSLADSPILDTTITWQQFCTYVNDLIVSVQSDISSSEDKRLGVYFVLESDLEYKEINFDKDDNKADVFESFEMEYRLLRKKKANNKISKDEVVLLSKINDALLQNRKFPEKVLKYLWDDAFKFNRDVFFGKNMTSLEKVVSSFIFTNGNNRWRMILNENVLAGLKLDN